MAVSGLTLCLPSLPDLILPLVQRLVPQLLLRLLDRKQGVIGPGCWAVLHVWKYSLDQLIVAHPHAGVFCGDEVLVVASLGALEGQGDGLSTISSIDVTPA